MTEALARISRTKETGNKKAPDTDQKHEKHPRHVDESGEDSIDISEEARERAAGKKFKNILDYINEEPA